jgi:hypothetical protein
MAQDRDTLRAVAWQELFPVLRLLSAARLALNFRLLLLAALALVGTVAGWRIIGELFAKSNVEGFQTIMEHNGTWPWERPVGAMPASVLLSPGEWFDGSPLVHGWHTITTPFLQIYNADTTLTQWTYWLCCALWSLVLWSFFGGAITRIAAVSFARHENVSFGKVAAFVHPRWVSYMFAPLMPILVTFFAAAVMAIVGVLANNFGVIIAGIFWPLLLIGGFVMAFLLIGLFFSWPLMWGAISTEGTDAFGALSHAYAYVYQRPLRYFLYAVLAAVVGVLGWFVVTQFAYWVEQLTYWGVSWGGLHVVRQATEEPLPIGIRLINFWNGAVWTLALAYVFSYFWVSTTLIYFLLRREVDATELDEVYFAEAQQLHGLPPLVRGADGVPEPADGPPQEAEKPSTDGG